MKKKSVKFFAKAILAGICALAVFCLTALPGMLTPTEKVLVPLSSADMEANLYARVVADLVKNKQGKVKYTEYSSKPAMEGSPFQHIKAEIMTKTGHRFTVTYMEDTRPAQVKDNLGNWLSVKTGSGEEFIDTDVKGIPSWSGQSEAIERSVWVEKYRTALKDIYSSM